MKLHPSGLRLSVVVGALVAVLSVPAAAQASDTFFLKNESKTVSFLGISLWGKGETMHTNCRTGPFPGPTETPFTFAPGDTGSITLTQDLFSDCLPGINPLIENTIEGPNITGGAWDWIAVDPFVGDAHLTCVISDVNGQWTVQSSLDGLTCTFSDAGNSTSGKFSSSVAPIRGGMRAVAYVQHFPGLKSKNRGRYAVAFRTLEKKKLGRKRVTLTTGKPRRVRVPISKAVRKQAEKNGSVKIRAVIRRNDGKAGSGDHATLIVREDSAEIPF